MVVGQQLHKNGVTTCNCITCQLFVMHRQQKGKGFCGIEDQIDNRTLDGMVERKCKHYKLGAMHQVRNRYTRMTVFDNTGKKSLK